MKAKIEQLDADGGSSFRAIRRSDRQFQFNWHYHRQYELTRIVTSHGRRFVGDDISEYGPGDFVLLGANLPHTWWSAEPSDGESPHVAVVVQFEEDFLGPRFFERPELAPIHNLLQRSSVGLEFSVPETHDAVQYISQLPDLPPLERTLRLLELLRILTQVSGRSLSTPGFVPELRSKQRRQIDRVCTYINAHYTEPLQQSEVAAMLQMSSARFSQFFRRSTGRTFVQYVNALRVALACRLLIDTDLSITEVCFQSGFFNVSNFNRRFKEVKSMSPNQFRKSHPSFQQP